MVDASDFLNVVFSLLRLDCWVPLPLQSNQTISLLYYNRSDNLFPVFAAVVVASNSLDAISHPLTGQLQSQGMFQIFHTLSEPYATKNMIATELKVLGVVVSNRSPC